MKCGFTIEILIQTEKWLHRNQTNFPLCCRGQIEKKVYLSFNNI